MLSITARIAQELQVREQQIAAAVALLDEGSTVPFISRYRKEVTGGLDDTQMRTLEERLGYLRELEERRQSILVSIEEQQKLTPELKHNILTADTKTRLEDLYLPYKPKRRTKGQIAIEAGIEPLAERLFNNPSLIPETEATEFINAEENFADTKAVLEGAKYILLERFAEDAELVGKVRQTLQQQGFVHATVAAGKEQEGEKFRDYFEYKEAINNIPSHRALALFRGRKEGILFLKVDLDFEETPKTHPCEFLIRQHLNIDDLQRPGDIWLADVIRWTWRVKLQMHLETELLGELRTVAEEAAIQVFARNLNDLLLAAPAGQRACIGLDPGLRTGVKVAVIDNTGKLVNHATIYPHAPKNQWDQSIALLAAIAQKYAIEIIAIGNGTASRETDKLAADLCKRHPELTLKTVVVSEAGASVYSASELAAKEFPNIDVTIRGAVSIARRLQDPLAELVKIEPKSIGVGQYQHDVNQTLLNKKLGAVVEDCVNAVGVEINTASAALLSSVSGLTASIAENIVTFRDTHGAIVNRQQLLEVPRMGAKTYELAAGFLRIRNGNNPLDASAVHPESYQVVEKIAQHTALPIEQIIGNTSLLKTLNPTDFADEQFGIPTITDILAELDKPGRDPRPEFKTATFKEGIETLKDLRPDMILEGVVTNVTAFGAFVDIGVHQDGLVHVSAMADRFIKDPHEVAKAGDIVKVKIMEVDIARKRIGLSMRMTDSAADTDNEKSSYRKDSSASNGGRPGNHQGQTRQAQKSTKAQIKKHGHQTAAPSTENNAFAAAFAKAKKKK